MSLSRGEPKLHLLAESYAVDHSGGDATSGGTRFEKWYPIRYHFAMDADQIIRHARHRAGLSLRGLASRAETSHSTLAAYESGRKVPTVATLDRILRAAGLELSTELTAAVGGADRRARGRELVEVLELAGMFPARRGAKLTYPPFGAR